MRLRHVPSFATWFLKLFSWTPEHESLIGDLAEQYLRGRGRLWYWKQVLAVLVLRCYREAPRAVLSSNPNRLRQAVALAFVVAAVSSVMLTEIWMLFIFGISGGVVAGILMLLRGAAHTETPKPSGDLAPYHRGISINHIPVEGPVGLLFALGTVLIFGGGIPAVRALLFVTVPLGLIGLGILLYWHKHHPVKIQTLHLHE